VNVDGVFKSTCVTAGKQRHHRNSGVVARVEHETVSLAKSWLCQRQSTQLIVFVRISPRKIEDDARGPVDNLRQRVAETFEIQMIAGAIGEPDVE
jgi:hypothetical protein